MIFIFFFFFQQAMMNERFVALKQEVNNNNTNNLLLCNNFKIIATFVLISMSYFKMNLSKNVFCVVLQQVVKFGIIAFINSRKHQIQQKLIDTSEFYMAFTQPDHTHCNTSRSTKSTTPTLMSWILWGNVKSQLLDRGRVVVYPTVLHRVS